MNQRLVIVGGGQAAAQLVQSSRRGGFAGPITLVCDEPHVPYQRPPLSKKYLAGELAAERLYIRPAQFYTDNAVELVVGNRACAVHVGRRETELADGRQLKFDRLVLATGAHPRQLAVPGVELEGVHYLRTLSDVDAIRSELAPHSHVVIVGAGYIGLEVAAVCSTLGHAVTVLEAAPRILSRVVCDTTAAFFHDYHERRGVRIECNAAITAIAGATRVASVRTQQGAEYRADCVIVGIGVEPNVELASSVGLACDNGIAVDVDACTDDEGMLAIGDCASYPHPWAQSRIRLESVHNAIQLAKTAAGTLCGAAEPFAEVPWFWSDQYDVKLQIAGLGARHDDAVVRGSIESGRFAVYYLRGGEITAVDAVNSPKDFIEAKALLASRARIPADVIADSAVALKDYPSRP